MLKVVLGEIETQEGRSGKQLPDPDIHKIVRKTLQGIDEMLTYKPGDCGLSREKLTLTNLLPSQLDKMDILIELSFVVDDIKSAKSDGQAIGIAMKHLKGKAVDGKDVANVVNGIRTKEVVS